MDHPGLARSRWKWISIRPVVTGLNHDDVGGQPQSPFARCNMVRAVLRAMVVLLMVGCAGPEAPDGALCRDVVTRLCAPPLCTEALRSLSVEEKTCEATLLQRTGCDAAEFTFTQPSRARVVECRVPLLRQGASQRAKVSCADVAEVFTDCPDFEAFWRPR